MPRALPLAAVGDCLLRLVRRRSTALILSAYVTALLLPDLGRTAGRTALIGSGPHAYRVPSPILAWTLVVLAAAALFAGTPVSPETQCLLAGLAIVAAMPVGGTAAAWTAHHGGDPALGLGVLAGSLAARPLTVPAGLAVGSSMTFGDLADDLARMTSVADGLRGMVTAILPAALGVLLRTLRPGLVAAAPPLLRVLTVAADVAGLASVNASGLPRDALLGADPEFRRRWPWRRCSCCAGTFAAGWLLAGCSRCSAPDTVALT